MIAFEQTLQRRAFDRQDLGPVLDFVEQHPGWGLDRATARWLLDRAANEDVFDLWHRDARALVVALLADCENPANATELVLLGLLLDGGEADRCEQALVWAEKRGQQCGWQRIEVTLSPVTSHLAPVLDRRRYERIRTDVTMERELGDVPLADLADDWADIDEANVSSAYECYRIAFSAVDGAQTPNEVDFRELVLTAAIRPRVLLRDSKVVALARVVWRDQATHLGEIRVICRHPAHPGLGERALAEAIRSLRQLGATRACLGVAGTNERAIQLYRRHGFTVTKHENVYQYMSIASCN